MLAFGIPVLASDITVSAFEITVSISDIAVWVIELTLSTFDIRLLEVIFIRLLDSAYKNRTREKANAEIGKAEMLK